MSEPSAVVIYHGDSCQDGFGAAYVAWTQLGDQAIYHPVFYNGKAPWPDVRGKDVWVLDYALPIDIYEKMKGEARTLRQLDHHKTAKEKYAAHGCTDPNCLFDMDHSGAMLAWNHFRPDQPAPKFLENIQDFDLWRFELETTVPFARGSRTRPMTFSEWDTFQSPVIHADIIQDGRVLEAQWSHWMNQLANEAIPITLAGETGWIVQSNGAFRSELGNLLAKRDDTYGWLWHGRANGEIACSLRSHNHPCDHLAHRFVGGGGHAHAAGFGLASFADMQALLPPGQASASPVPRWAPSPSRSSDEVSHALAILAKVESWQGEEAGLSLRVDGRAGGQFPPLTTPDARVAAGRLLVAQRQQVAATVMAEAKITSITEHGHTAAWVLADGTVDEEVVEGLLAAGHQAVQTVRMTATGWQATAYGDPVWVARAWPDAEGFPTSRRRASPR